ncbi:MAG: aminotransferase class IV [Clostridiales bacterium]|nr:aminotransferase class IV [Clostridiales bacterium]
MNEGLKFGYGLFETILYENKELRHFDKHMARLKRSLEVLQMASIDEGNLEVNALKELRKTSDNAIRISCYKNGKKLRVTYETRLSQKKEFYRVGISSIKRHSEDVLLQHKSSCHLSNYIEKRSLVDSTYDEAIHYNEKGQLTEGIYTNLFFVKNKELFTPDISCGLLPGITRNNVIELAKSLGIPVNIGYYSNEVIQSSDEVFLTNALIKIMPVESVESQVFSLEKNTITQLLMKEML